MTDTSSETAASTLVLLSAAALPIARGRPRPSPPHIVLELVYSQCPWLPAINVTTRDTKRRSVRGLRVPLTSETSTVVRRGLEAFSRLTRVRVYRSHSCTWALYSLDLMGMASLTHLDVSDCNLGRTVGLSSMQSLTHLNLSNNGVYNSQALASLTKLRFLDITHCSIKRTDFLRSLGSLEELYMPKNSITGVDLVGLTRLRTLDIRLCNLDEYEHLTSLTSLKTLLLLSNSIPRGESSYLSHLTGLERLELVLVKTFGGEECLDALTGLTRLSLQQMRSYDYPWLNKVSKLTNLASLDLSMCHVLPRHLEGLLAMSALTELSLAGCRLGNSGANVIAKISTLRDLNVRGCHVVNHSLLAPLCQLTSLSITPKHNEAWYKVLFPDLSLNASSL